MTADPPPPDPQTPRRPSGAIPALRVGLGGVRSGAGALVALAALVAAGVAGIWLLGNDRTATPGRPLGAAGDLKLVARAAREGETMEVWKGADRLVRLGVTDAERFQRFEMTSQDINVGGGPAPDLVVYGWTGGMHCCITHFVVDGDSGALLGRIEQGDGEPARFVAPERSQGRQASPAVMPVWDDVGAGQYGTMATSPLGRVLVNWQGEAGFGLDLAAMRASGPDAPPAFWTTNPALVAALIDQGGSGDFVPEAATGTRGGVARSYQAWLGRLRADLAAARLDPVSPESFIPLARFLNAYAYKGQFDAGLAEARRLAGGQQPEFEEALRHWIVVLAESRWFGDLDRLNDGALARLSDSAGR